MESVQAVEQQKKARRANRGGGEPRGSPLPGEPFPGAPFPSPLLSRCLPAAPPRPSRTPTAPCGASPTCRGAPRGSAGLRIALLGRAPPARPPLPTAPSGSGAPRPPAPPELWLRSAPQPLGHSRPSPRGGGGGEARVAVPPARVLPRGGEGVKVGASLSFPPHPAPGGAGGAPRAEAAAGGSWIKKRKMSL